LRYYCPVNSSTRVGSLVTFPAKHRPTCPFTLVTNLQIMN